VQDFLELTRKFPELTDPAYEPLIGDTLQSEPSEDIVDVVSGYSSRAPAHTQLIVLRDDRLDPQTGKKTSYSGMAIVIANKVFPIQKK
jgi:hypothetical protein